MRVSWRNPLQGHPSAVFIPMAHVFDQVWDDIAHDRPFVFNLFLSDGKPSVEAETLRSSAEHEGLLATQKGILEQKAAGGEGPEGQDAQGEIIPPNTSSFSYQVQDQDQEQQHELEEEDSVYETADEGEDEETVLIIEEGKRKETVNTWEDKDEEKETVLVIEGKRKETEDVLDEEGKREEIVDVAIKKVKEGEDKKKTVEEDTEEDNTADGGREKVIVNTPISSSSSLLLDIAKVFPSKIITTLVIMTEIYVVLIVLDQFLPLPLPLLPRSIIQDFTPHESNNPFLSLLSQSVIQYFTPH